MFRRPLLRFIFRRFLAIPKRRFLNDVGAGRKIITRLKQGFVIGVFPEGERSWSGATQDWKPEAVALFQRFPDVPVLPVRIDGNYFAWPRWASGIRRGKVLLTVHEPFRVVPGMTPEDIERELRAKVEPIDQDLCLRSAPPAAGIERLIYRCPHCDSWKPLIPSSPSSAFRCADCSTRFMLEPDYQVGSKGKSESLPAAYDRIRVREADLGPLSAVRTPQSAVGGEAVLWQESGNALRQLGTGRLALTNRHLEFSNEKLALRIPLEQVRSVTTESNSRIQIWLSREHPLYQLTFPGESVLKWQDFIVAAIEHEFHFSPNRR
jgi:1-acyl-sn-glycerol-3-phosphate acyltransferase